MKPRVNFHQAAPDTINALRALETQVQASGLEQSLIELVKIRASQINGCAYCINMHTQDARKHGVRLVFVFKQSARWQKVTFEALRVFVKDDGLFELRGRP